MKTPTESNLASQAERVGPHSVSDSEQRMWGAVVLRAIADAVWCDKDPNGHHSKHVSFYGEMVRRSVANRLRDESVFWLTFDNRGFHEVCSAAGLEPSMVRRWAVKAMAGSDDDKARWATADLSLHELRPTGELRN